MNMSPPLPNQNTSWEGELKGHRRDRLEEEATSFQSCFSVHTMPSWKQLETASSSNLKKRVGKGKEKETTFSQSQVGHLPLGQITTHRMPYLKCNP